MTRILSVFGVAGEADPLGLGGGADGAGASRQDVLAPYLDSICGFRDKVRTLVRAKAEPGEVLRACDELRDSTLPSLGVKLDDTGGGALWKVYECAICLFCNPPLFSAACLRSLAFFALLRFSVHLVIWFAVSGLC